MGMYKVIVNRVMIELGISAQVGTPSFAITSYIQSART